MYQHFTTERHFRFFS